MVEWWKHHHLRFADFSEADKQRVEDLTGCIPLLLEPFVRSKGKTLDDLEPQIWEDPVLLSVHKSTIDFGQKKLVEGERLRA